MRPSSHRPPLPLGGAEDLAKVSICCGILHLILLVCKMLQQGGHYTHDIIYSGSIRSNGDDRGLHLSSSFRILVDLNH